MLDDQQLLRGFVKDGSEAAFTELVTRHVNLVYSAALRRTGDRSSPTWREKLIPCPGAWCSPGGCIGRRVLPPRKCSAPNDAATHANRRPWP